MSSSNDFRRALLTIRLLSMCARQLREPDTIALGSHLRVYATTERVFLRPALVLVKDEANYLSARQDTVTNPHAIIEFATAETFGSVEADLRSYKSLASASHLVVVMCERVKVLHIQRVTGDQWDTSPRDRGQRVAIESMDIDILVDHIYAWR